MERVSRLVKECADIALTHLILLTYCELLDALIVLRSLVLLGCILSGETFS